MRVKLTITSRDGSERSETRPARLTSEGVEFDGPGLSLQDGDRVVWSADRPGLCGAFDVAISGPVLH